MKPTLNINHIFNQDQKEEILSFANPLYELYEKNEIKEVLSFKNPVYVLEELKELDKDKESESLFKL